MENKDRFIIGQKIKKCKCGCGEWIIYKSKQKYSGIPNYIQGHNLRELKPWNKGLCADNDERVRKNIEKASKTFRKLYKLGKIKPTKFWLGMKISEELKMKRKAYEGHPHTEQSKEKIRKKVFERIRNGTFFYPNVKDTSIEIKIQNFLRQLGIRFLTHKYIKIEHTYQCDIFIPSMNLVIECDGDYWHNYPHGNNLDHSRNIQMYLGGINVLRLWEHEIREMDINTFRGILFSDEILDKFLKKRNERLFKNFIEPLGIEV